jgi:catechol 2,3-dioxygenase-like lactoylglutathione lyase family enzyme
MITGLDHLVLVCPDISVGRAAYEAVLGRAPDWQAEDIEGGTANCLFRLANTGLELLAPDRKSVV